MIRRLASLVLVVLLAVGVAGYAGALNGGGEGKLEYKVYSIEQIMSGAYKVYGNPKLGFWVAKVVITNTGNAPITDVRIRYSIDNYARETEKSYPILVPGGTVVDLYYPIISSEVTKLTAATPTNLRITIVYNINGETHETRVEKPLKILGVNDFVFSSLNPEESTGSFYDTFNNAPLLAAWVTPSDPVVREFADLGNKLAGGAGASLSDDEALKSLAGMWELAKLNGFSYKTEAEGYWTGKFSEHIMFPRDVIRDKSGTCIDLALWFASLAMSQGLKAYIVLIPGHAFPLVELPSGTLIPIEATTINSGVSFEEAIQVGIEKSWQMAMSGPHMIIDIATLHSEGVVPPELPELPPDVLSRWGIGIPTPDNDSGTAQEGPTNGVDETESGNNDQVEWNTYMGEYFTFQYPAGWNTPEDYGGIVYLGSPDEKFEFIVFYYPGASVEDMVNFVEDALLQSGIQINAREETQSTIAGMTVYTVLYSLSSAYGDYAAVARYFTTNGIGFAVMYDFMRDSAEYNQLGEYMVSTFRVG